MKWIVEIVAYADEKVERRFEYSGERLAEKAESGVNRNLNHELYFTRIVSED